MKKSSLSLVFASAILFVLVFSVVNVSAAEPGPVAKMFGDLANGVANSLEPVAKVLVGTSYSGTGEEGAVFFGRLLMIILVFSIVYVVLNNLAFFEEAVWVPWVVSGALALVSVRFLSVEWIRTVILPNQVFAVVVSAGLPFALFFLLIKDWQSRTARRLAWVFFAVVFVAMWAARAEKLGEVSYIYPLTALGALVMIMFDGTWRRWMAQIQMERLGATTNAMAISELQTRINDVRQRMMPADPAHPSRGTLTVAAGNKLLREYEKRMKELLRQ